MINIGIDQASIIAQIKIVHDIGDWIIKSNSVISNVESALSLEAIFGCKRESNAPAPYSVGIEFGYHDFYFRVAFHPSNPKTGIMIKFSAHALEYYRVRFKELFAKEIDLNRILQTLDTIDAIIDPCNGPLFSDVTYRCSRIDVYIDYIDENIDITDLYIGLIQQRYTIRHANGRKNQSKLHGRTKADKYETFYVGNPRQRNKRSLLRVYDKKTEELANRKAFRLDTAKECDNWIRLETEFSECYAHDLTDSLKDADSKSFHSIILNAVLERYRFCYSDKNEYLPVTSMLLDKNIESSFSFQSRIESDPTIDRKISYMLYGSGLIPLLYVINEVWGEEGLNYIYSLIDASRIDFIPSRKERKWLRVHKDDLAEIPLFFQDGIET